MLCDSVYTTLLVDARLLSVSSLQCLIFLISGDQCNTPSIERTITVAGIIEHGLNTQTIVMCMHLHTHTHCDTSNAFARS